MENVKCKMQNEKFDKIKLVRRRGGRLRPPVRYCKFHKNNTLTVGVNKMQNAESGIREEGKGDTQ
jgi:hypothetical protein